MSFNEFAQNLMTHERKKIAQIILVDLINPEIFQKIGKSIFM